MTITQRYESMSNEELMLLFLETREQAVKQELVLRHAYIVKTIAMQLRGVYISIADMDDIINEGIIALMDALDRFDPSKNVKFASFASLRIRGAIVDYARKQDWAPRSVRKIAKEIDNAMGELQIDLGRSPTEQEMADKLGMTLTKYRKSVRDSSLYNLLSLNAIIDEGQSERRLTLGTGAETDSDPSLRLQEKDLQEALREAIVSLKPKEQLVISLYFRKELNMKEIAKVLGVSEPRISQIQSGALSKLRAAMEKYLKE